MNRFLVCWACVLAVFCRSFGGECGCCACDLLTYEGAGAKKSGKTLVWSQGEADTNRVDVLIALDESARKWIASNGETVDSFGDDSICLLNCVISQTGLDQFFSFRLAGIYEVPADLSGYNYQFLCTYACGKFEHRDLKGLFKPMREFRNQVAADIVVLLTDPISPDYHGNTMGFFPEYASSSGLKTFAEYAYSVVDVKMALSSQTLAHEVGHLFGAGHCDGQKTQPGPLLKSYSSGYRFACGGVEYVTIMGYAVAGGATYPEVIRLPFFSSPEYEYNGVPVGTAAKNDNTRTLRETYALIANFRVATPLPGYEQKSQEEEPEQQAERGILVSVIRGEDESVSEGQEVVLNLFVTDRFAVQATAPSSKKVTVRVTGLPTGMKFTSKTGIVSGFPKKAGRHAVKVSATCKGEKKKVMTFIVRVNESQAWLAGDYWGLVNVDGEESLGTLKVSTAGKISLKCRCGGRTRTFTGTGFSRGGGSEGYASELSVKIGATRRTLALGLENRRATFSGGCLLQKPWGRKDVTAPKIKKQIKATYGDLSVRISTRGKATISGKVNGVRVSGASQVVMTTEDDGGCRLLLPIALNAKKGFGGLFEWTAVEIAGEGPVIKKVE